MPKRKSQKQKGSTKNNKQIKVDSEIASLWKSTHCFQHILSFVEPAFILQKCSQVCSVWRETTTSEDLWANFCRNKFNSKEERDLCEIQKLEGKLSYATIYFTFPWWEWRYKNGEHNGQKNLETYKKVWKEIEQSVWHELSPWNKKQVDSVAIETFTRCKDNLLVIKERLAELGYPPIPIIELSNRKTTEKEIKKIEEKIGHPVPVLWKHFWTIVGQVNMVGWCSSYFSTRFDFWASKGGIKRDDVYDNPLSIHGPDEDHIREWDLNEENDQIFHYFIAGDGVMKAGVSGGALTCTLDLESGIGFKVVGEIDLDKPDIPRVMFNFQEIKEKAPTLVTLLRQHILQFGGFPGFADSPNRKNRKISKILATLTKDLKEF